MNKGLKRVLIVSFILIFAGIALLGGALIASKGDFKTITGALQKVGVFVDGVNAIEKTQTFEMPDSLKKIDISFVNSDLTVKLSPDKKVHVSYEQRKNFTYSEDASNDRLYINEQANWLFNFSFKRTKVIIELPEETFLSDLNLKNVNGEIFVEETKAERASLNGVNTTANLEGAAILSVNFGTVNGNLNITNSKIGLISQKSVNGSVNLSTSTFGDLTMETTNGSATIIVPGTKDDYKVDFEVVNGSLSINNDTFKGTTHLSGSAPKSRVSFKGVNASLTLKTEIVALPD